MQEQILEAFNEVYKADYKTFEEIQCNYSTIEILDVWLRYEGIVGYTRNIVDLLGECGVYLED